MIRLTDIHDAAIYIEPKNIASVSLRKAGAGAGGSYVLTTGGGDAVAVAEPPLTVLGLGTLWRNRDRLREEGLLTDDAPLMAAAYNKERGYHFIYADWEG